MRTRKPREKAAIRQSDLARLLKAQEYRCAYTGDALTPENVSADHVVSLMRGGPHELENVRLVLRVVNTMKGTLSLDEFVYWCGRVWEYLGKSGLKPLKGSSGNGHEPDPRLPGL